MSVDLEAVRKLEEQLRADERRARDVAPKADADRLAAIADTLRDLRAEVAGLTFRNKELGATNDSISGHIELIERERDGLRAEVDRIDTDCDEIDAKWATMGNRLREVAIERDAALARVKELESEVAAMRPVVVAAEREVDCYPSSRAWMLVWIRSAISAYRARKP